HDRLLDWAIIGASHMAKQVTDFSAWSKETLACVWPKQLPEEAALRPLLWKTYNNSKMLLERAQKVSPQSFRWWNLQALASARSLTISDDLIKCAEPYADRSIGDLIAWRRSLTIRWRHDPTIRTARLLSIIGGPRNYASLAQVLGDTNRRWDLRIECYKTLVT